MKNNPQTRKGTNEFYTEWELIASEVEGLYIEADKLAKKSPATKITQLELDTTNYIIEKVKKLLNGDTFIDRLKKFVPAGDNPEYREVVLVLRQVIQGMNRYIPSRSSSIHI